MLTCTLLILGLNYKSMFVKTKPHFWLLTQIMNIWIIYKASKSIRYFSLLYRWLAPMPRWLVKYWYDMWNQITCSMPLTYLCLAWRNLMAANWASIDKISHVSIIDTSIICLTFIVWILWSNNWVELIFTKALEQQKMSSSKYFKHFLF